MNDAGNPYRAWGTIAAQAETNERADFIRKTYLNLAGAVLAFIAIEAVLLNTPGVENMAMKMMGHWWLVLLAFIGVSYIADRWARSATSIGMQYAGLALYVVAEAIIFAPILYLAQVFSAQSDAAVGVIPAAGIITLVVFSGLTCIVFMTGSDFSFLRTGLYVASFAALGLIFCSMIFGFNLGLLFIGVMILLASGYILYDTSNVLHHYHIGQHVAAALALFASVALLFWYVLQLVMRLTSRD